jgi:hypothetical protein
MSLDQKLVALSKGPETLMLKDLVGRPAAPIIAARRVSTRYGKPAVLDIQGDGVVSSVFLPNKYADTLEDHEVEAIGREGYKITVTASEGTSKLPNVSIAK